MIRIGSALAALGLGRVHARHIESSDDLAVDPFEALRNQDAIAQQLAHPPRCSPTSH